MRSSILLRAMKISHPRHDRRPGERSGASTDSRQLVWATAPGGRRQEAVMTDYFYDLMLRQMAREQQEWDRQMEHQGWFRRPPTVPVLTRCRMTIGGLLISLGTRLQQPTHGPLPTQSGNASDARSS